MQITLLPLSLENRFQNTATSKSCLQPELEVPKELPELPGRGYTLLKTWGCMCMLKWHLLHLGTIEHYFHWMCLTLSTGIIFEIQRGKKKKIQSARMLLNFLVTTLSYFNKHKSFAQDNFNFVEPDCLLRKPFWQKGDGCSQSQFANSVFQPWRIVALQNRVWMTGQPSS